MTIALVGDLHGCADSLRFVLDELAPHRPDAVIQVGDFGYYPDTAQDLVSVGFSVPFYWIDGNHEDHALLAGVTEPTELVPNCWYMPRGTVAHIDGRKVGFLGGAASVDKFIRLQYGMHWSPLEQVTTDDLARLVRASAHVDLLVTHTPPQSVIDRHFDPRYLVYRFGLTLDWRDPSATHVESAWEYFERPPLYCGHMHRSIADGAVRILDCREWVLV